MGRVSLHVTYILSRTLTTNHEKRSFIFDTELRLVVLTGLKAHNLSELRELLVTVPRSSIFFHTHQQYLAHNFRRPHYYSDFALWVSQALREEALAEKLAAIDLLAFTTMRELRAAFVAVIDEYVAKRPTPLPVSRPDEAFHFCRSKSFVLPTGIVADDVPDFFAKLPFITNASLYFHFFEARLRLHRRTNDFSRWLQDRGRRDLAHAIDELNPYIRTLDELKQDIIQVGQQLVSDA